MYMWTLGVANKIAHSKNNTSCVIVLLENSHTNFPYWVTHERLPTKGLFSNKTLMCVCVWQISIPLISANKRCFGGCYGQVPLAIISSFLVCRKKVSQAYILCIKTQLTDPLSHTHIRSLSFSLYIYLYCHFVNYFLHVGHTKQVLLWISLTN